MNSEEMNRQLEYINNCVKESISSFNHELQKRLTKLQQLTDLGAIQKELVQIAITIVYEIEHVSAYAATHRAYSFALRNSKLS